MVTYVLSRRQVVWADSFRLVGAAWQLSAVRPPDAAFLIESVGAGASSRGSAMSNRSAAVAEAVVPFAPKLNDRTGDQLDRAGQAIVGLLHQAASTAEANNQQAIDMAHKLSAQLRAAEDRIREFEAKVHHHQDRADRAERWLYQISVEIEQNFLSRDNSRSSQPRSPQAVSSQKR
jgi:hypothetical protein